MASNKKPLIGLIVTEFETLTGVIDAGDSRRMIFKIRMDNGKQATFTLMPNDGLSQGFTETSDLKIPKQSYDCLKAIIGAKKIGINAPHEVAKLCGRRVSLSSFGLKILNEESDDPVEPVC